jgi:TRAP-type C4-dicarboxylate transport system substrate-binding protein
MKLMTKFLTGALATTFLGLAAPAMAADVSIKAVGTWGNLSNFFKHEQPFWTTGIGEATGGAITGEIKPLTELGLKGTEIMRLLKLGVFDYAHGLPGYVAEENAIFEGADLAGLTQDIATERKVADTYFPTMETKFAEIYNAKLLQLYPFPSQTLWCAKPVANIGDLKGMKIRTYSATLGDFVEGVGGTSVSVPFGEVIPALEKGVVDCAVTGTMSAYTAKWNQVATHAYTLRVGWGLAFGAMNMDKWNSLTPEQQTTLKGEIDKLTEAMWAETATEDDVAIACLTGGKCDIGEGANMTLVTPSDEDKAALNTIATDVILKRWASRCDEACITNWNETVGPLLGLTAAK